ncbi:hypothetical protein Bca101_010488 [Brassica carinata]
MEIMSQHTSCQTCGTDCRDVISVIKDLSAWPTYSTELTELEAIKRRYQKFKIIHVPRNKNKTVDALARTARTFHRDLLFFWLFYPGLDSQTTSSLSDRIAF